ncbi:UNVERIFIED_CONTAM: hypothetical protein GTU68_023361 [Idotea baltica]|nr:hypothetical protein [Idotea baltica]
MNDLMSGGAHRIWKSAMIDWLAPRDGWRMLDVAGGTGDISFRMLERVNKRGGRADSTVLDLTEDMLRAGRTRSESEKLSDQLNWVTGDAMKLPFEDGQFDAYTISFGIRNVTRIQRPGGRFLCLEFSQMTVPMAQQAYDAYSYNVIPRIGEVVAKDRDSYQYLVESIRRFPDQETFGAMIEDAGFEQVKWRNLTGGIAALHSGWKL